MKKIDTKQWKEFMIYELCETTMIGNKLQVPTGASVSAKQLREGNIPKISVSSVNNGIVGYYYSDDKNYRVYNNFISVSFLGTVFYQEGDAQLDMKVHCLKLKGIELNRNLALFLVAVIRKSIMLYNYSDQISSTVLPYLSVKLPVDETGSPDFSYMESYMKNLELAVSSSLTGLQSAKKFDVSGRIDVSTWQTFHLYDIFKIDSGTKLDKAKMDTTMPAINFVGRSNFNNGITQKVNEIQGLKPFGSGCLTLALGGAYLGSCFIQEEPFYTSQNVVVLIPKENISFEAKQFIATAIFKESQNNYRAFIKELNAHIKKDFAIKLPANVDGTPNYVYMSRYIARIKKHCINTFDALQTV